MRQTLAALRPTVTQALDRVDEAPPPPRPPSRRRHALRLGAVAATFVALAIASYRPTKLRAQRLHPPAAPVATTVPAPATPAATAVPVAVPPPPLTPTVAPADSPSPTHPATRRGKRHRRDSNYLLDPFAR